MEKLIEFLKSLQNKKFWGTTVIKWENGEPVLFQRIIENVKIK